MTAAVTAEAVVLLAAIFLFLRYLSGLQAAWADERRELLNRIQHPELVPAKPVTEFVVPESKPDQLNLVGHINYDDDGGEDVG